MKKVLLSKAIQPAAMELLAGKVEPIILSDTSVKSVKQAVAEVVGIILRTNIMITREILEAAPNLKLISRTGVGIDNIDVETATQKGILVCHTPGVNANSVAEQAVTLLLSLAKQIKPMDNAVRTGNWKRRSGSNASDIDGKTLGVIGLGRIGTLVARKCRLAFNMKVLGYDPYISEAEGIELCSDLEQVFNQADFVSIHVPYMKATHHLVDARLLGLMKPESYLINTSRGALVDEKALIEALQSKSIAGAGLDVFEQEPPALDNPMLVMENVVCTPHSGALTRECELKVALTAAQAIVDYIEGKQPQYVYNRRELALR